MEKKTVTLDLEAYEALRRRRREGESFIDVVRRLTGARRPLSDLAGLWKDMPSADFRRVQDLRRRTPDSR